MKESKDFFPDDVCFPEKELPESDPGMKDLEPIKVDPFQEDEIMLEPDPKKSGSEEIKTQ